jgi:hypothetical protein
MEEQDDHCKKHGLELCTVCSEKALAKHQTKKKKKKPICATFLSPDIKDKNKNSNHNTRQSLN